MPGIKCTRDKEIDKLLLAQQAWKENHKIDWNKLKIPDKGNTKRELLEAVHMAITPTATSCYYTKPMSVYAPCMQTTITDLCPAEKPKPGFSRRREKRRPQLVGSLG
ncbi:hypothetical protein Trydic_g1296 [Trypoxylus dichotomus]